jgi:hypothetical protein
MSLLARDWSSTQLAPAPTVDNGYPVAKNVEPKVAFADKWPAVDNPIKTTAFQRVECRKQLRLASVGIYEFELALRRVPSDAKFADKLIAQIITDWRAENLSQKAGFAGGVEWDYAESDRLAEIQLLEASSTVQKANDLRSKAGEAARLAEAAEKEWKKEHAELVRIPAQIEQLAQRLQGIAEERNYLTNVDALRREYRELYTQLLVGNFVGAEGIKARNRIIESLAKLWSLLQESSFRLEIVTDVEKSISAELKELREKQKQLTKKLGAR